MSCAVLNAEAFVCNVLLPHVSPVLLAEMAGKIHMLFCPMLLKMRSQVAIMTPQQQQSALGTDRLWPVGCHFCAMVRCIRVHAVFAAMVPSIWEGPLYLGGPLYSGGGGGGDASWQSEKIKPSAT